MSIDSNANNPPSLPPISPFPTTDPNGLLTPPPIVPTGGAADSTEVASSPSSSTTSLNINLPLPTPSDLQGMTWVQFLTLMWKTAYEQQKQSQKEELPSAHQRGMHIYGMTEAAELAKLFEDIDRYLAQVQRIRMEQEQQNQLIKNLNIQIQQATDKMNDAIQKHNDKKMNDQDFQKAVNEYNAERQRLQSLIQNTLSTINQNVSSINGEIDEANNLSKDWDVDSINHLEDLQTSLTLPVVTSETTSLIPGSSLTPQTNVTANVPSRDALTEKLYNERVDDFINSMQLISQAEKVTENIRESHFALLKLIFPNATAGQLAALAGGASVTNAVISLTSSAIQAILNQAILLSMLQKENVESSDALANQLQSSALREIVLASLYSVLGINPTAGDSQAIVANVAINFAGYISKFLSSKALDQIMQTYAEQYQLTEKETQSLKAVLSQTLWTIAVSNLAQATGMYGLPTQLLGNLPEFDPSTNEKPLNLKTTFADPGERQAFEEQLIHLIMTKSRTTLEAARVVADNIVGALQVLDNTSPEQIHKTLLKQLGSNFDSTTSNAIASAGLTSILNSRLNTEISEHPVYLSNSLIQGSQYLNTINNQQSPFVLDNVQRDKFVSSLAAQLQSPSLSLADATIDANSIWENVRAKPSYASMSDFQKAVSQSIVSTVGITPDAALKISQQIDLGVGNLPLNPLLNPGKTDILSREALTASFQAQLNLFYINHGFSPSEAQKQSSAATATLFTDPHSLPNVMLTINDNFKKADIKNSNDLWVETYREDSAISRELSVFIASTTVNPLLYSQLVTITGGTAGGKFELPIQG